MSQISIRLDFKLKTDAAKLADMIGFSFNDLVTVLLKKAIHEKGVDLRYTNSFSGSVKIKKPSIKNRLIA